EDDHRYRSGRGHRHPDPGPGRGRSSLHQGEHHRFLPPDRQHQPDDRCRGPRRSGRHEHPAADLPPPHPDRGALFPGTGAGAPLHARELRGRGRGRRRLRRQCLPVRTPV
ncbi:MAG: protein from nitrogen regulatory protein P-II (GLNB) family, ortholog YAAQ B. subtilis, partial [uncultured Thermomicrobiales bacterium]